MLLSGGQERLQLSGKIFRARKGSAFDEDRHDDSAFFEGCADLAGHKIIGFAKARIPVGAGQPFVSDDCNQDRAGREHGVEPGYKIAAGLDTGNVDEYPSRKESLDPVSQPRCEERIGSSIADKYTMFHSLYVRDEVTV